MNGTKYRHCTLWRQIAGKGEACQGQCKEEQKLACFEQQLDDAKEAEGQLTDDEIWGGLPEEARQRSFKVALHKQ